MGPPGFGASQLCFLKHLFRGRVRSHRRPGELRRVMTSLLKNPMTRNHTCEAHALSHCFRLDPHALCVWPRGGLFQLRPPPSVLSGIDKTSYPLGFLVWYLDFLLFVVIVSDNPFYLGFLRDFLSL